MRGKNLICPVALGVLMMAVAFAQTPSPEGIAIDDQLTLTKCGGCHPRDAKGMMRRLSYIRTTPEVWEESIRRMVRLNGVALQPGEAHQILKYLSYNNGLAPEEAKPIFWEVEHRLFRDQSDKIPDEALQHTCNYCHTIGRVLSQRRTREDYQKLINMHLGLFPGAENTLRPRKPVELEELPPELTAPNGSNPYIVPNNPSPVPIRADGKYPADVAIDYLAKAQPLITPQWTAWKAAMRTPNLTGKWMLVGYQQGKGRVFGTLTVTAGAAPDEFVTKTEIEYATSGITAALSGKAVLYTGYSWRGKSTGPSTTQSADPGTSPTELREALLVSRDGNTMDGRWFWGGYQEFGIDAHLVRIASTPLLAGASSFSDSIPIHNRSTALRREFSRGCEAGRLRFWQRDQRQTGGEAHTVGGDAGGGSERETADGYPRHFVWAFHGRARDRGIRQDRVHQNTSGREHGSAGRYNRCKTVRAV